MPAPKDPVKREEWINKISGKNNPMFGSSGEKHPLFGIKRPWVSKRNKTKEMREKVSASKRGKNNPMFGKTGDKSPLFGTHPTKETREKQSKSRAGRFGGVNHPMYGKTHTKESCQMMSDARLGRFSGGNHYNWKGGISFEPYPATFNAAFKRFIREFYGNVCFECGATPEESGEELSVHHYDYDKNSKNCIPLCRGCNARVNYKRDFWEKHFTQIINEKYIGQGVRI